MTTAALSPIITGQSETLVPLRHLQRMVTFCRGVGVEFLPQFDEDNRRKSFIEGLVKVNRLKTRIRGMIIQMVKRGRLLLYLRPTGKTYKIQSYRPDQYRAYYDKNDDLESVVVIYSYKYKPLNAQPRDRWVKLRITAATVETSESDNRPDFDTDNSTAPAKAPAPNPLGFLSCVEVLNTPPASEVDGVGDFDQLMPKLEAHDDLMSGIITNLYIFANSPLVTNREAAEVTEAMGIDSPIPGKDSIGSVAYASGFRETVEHMPDTNRARRSQLRRIKRVIGGWEAEDTLQQLRINPVPPDQLLFVRDYGDQLLEILGGAGSQALETATEASNIFAQVEATAAEKQEALFGQGLCKILEMAIQAEEALWSASSAIPGAAVVGLAPVINENGVNDRTVQYRVGSVYKPNADSLNLRSITARNLMKFAGVSQRAAIQYIFPDRSETEIDRMVGEGGLPSDNLNTAIAIFQSLQQPDPLTGIPPTNDLGIPLYRLVQPFIEQSLNYGSQFSPISPDDRSDPTRELAALTAALSRVAGDIRRANDPLDPAMADGNRGSADALPSPGATVAESPTPGTLPGFFDLTRSPILRALGAVR